LNEDRLIEAERVTHFRDLAGSSAFAEHLLHRIAGDNVYQKKNEGEHQPECGKRQKEAMQEVANHSRYECKGILGWFGKRRVELLPKIRVLSPIGEKTRSIKGEEYTTRITE